MESNYIIKQGNTIYPFELEDADKKFLLNPNKIENEVNRIYFRQDIQKFLGSYTDEKSSEVTHQMGVFGKIASYMNLYLYDLEEYNKLYPNGFHTENKIFIPNHLFENMLTQETKKGSEIKRESITSNAPVMIIKSLISVFENLYQVNFSDAEKSKIFSEQINGIFTYKAKRAISNFEHSDKTFGNLEFVPTKKFKESLIENGFSLPMIDYVCASDDSKFIDILLSQSDELFSDYHPFSKLQHKVMENMKSINVNSITSSKDLIEELIENSLETNPQDLMKVNSSLSSIAKQVIDNDSNKKSDIVKIINDLSEKWIPSAMQLDNGAFSTAYIDLLNQLTNYYGKNFDTAKKENLVMEMISGDCSQERKDFVIALATEVAINTRNPITFLHKEKENNQNVFFEACAKGDVATIKNLLSNSNDEARPDIFGENNHGFTLASNNNQKNVLLYLLTSEDLIQNVPIHDVWKTLIYKKHVDVFDELLSKNILTLSSDKDIIFEMAFAFEKKELFKKVLDIKQDDSDIIKMFELLNKYNSSDSANFEMSRILIDKMMEYPNIDKFNYKFSDVFFAAAQGNNLEILRTLIFDYNIELSDDTRKKLEEHYPDINNFFKIRELNRELNLEITNNEADVPKPKPKRIKI